MQSSGCNLQASAQFIQRLMRPRSSARRAAGCVDFTDATEYGGQWRAHQLASNNACVTSLTALRTTTCAVTPHRAHLTMYLEAVASPTMSTFYASRLRCIGAKPSAVARRTGVADTCRLAAIYTITTGCGHIRSPPMHSERSAFQQAQQVLEPTSLRPRRTPRNGLRLSGDRGVSFGGRFLRQRTNENVREVNGLSNCCSFYWQG